MVPDDCFVVNDTFLSTEIPWTIPDELSTGFTVPADATFPSFTSNPNTGKISIKITNY